MKTTIFGAVLTALIFLFIFDATVESFGGSKYTIRNLSPDTLYKILFTLIFLFSILYIFVAAWMLINFGETPGLIFK